MVTPYLLFSGNCREALDFYANAFNTQVLMLQTYDDYIPLGLSSPPANLGTWVLHAQMQICGTLFWFADEAAAPVAKGTMVQLSATLPTKQEAQRVFQALGEGASITLPPTDTFYSRFHAGLTDRFGIGWNIVAEEAPLP